MKFNPDIHHRHSLRLKNYDYSHAGAYFVTVCAQNREYLFGGISNGEAVLNEAGRMVRSIWETLPEDFQVVRLDQFMVMPNHFHGIIMLNACHAPYSINNRRGESCIHPASPIYPESPIRPSTRPDVADGSGEKGNPLKNGDCGKKGDHKDRPYGTADNSLGRIIQAFKSLTTHTYVNGVKNHGWTPFPGCLWQRNYYEHVIRNDVELNSIRQYIMDNPLKWELDEENPLNAKKKL